MGYIIGGFMAVLAETSISRGIVIDRPILILAGAGLYLLGMSIKIAFHEK